jgi:hypothetical protein
MIGKERSEFAPAATRETLWTLENDPVPFVLVNSVFVLPGIGLIIWGLFLRKSP